MDPHDDPRDPRDPRHRRDTRAPHDPDPSRGEPVDDVDDVDNAQQSAVRDLLASQADPGPMPAAVEQRLFGALERAGEVRSSDRELFDELGLVEEPLDDDSDVIRFPRAGGQSGPGEPGDGEADPDARAAAGASGDPVALLRRRWPVLVAAAAAVALLAFAGLNLFGTTRSSNDGLASLPGSGGATSPGGGVATSVAGRLHVQASDTAYTADNLASSARALITSPGPQIGADQVSTLGTLATPDGANACVAALGDADAPSVTIDLATYAGQPAAVVVIARPDKTTAYAVQRGCATGDPEVIKDAVPVP